MKSWQIVFEWEDILSDILKQPLTYNTDFNVGFYIIGKKLKISSGFQLVDALSKPDKYSLYFEMTAKDHFTHSSKHNIIPVIVDFFFKREELPLFYQAFRNCKLILISSLEVYDFLVENKCPLNIRHFALSISDIYKLTEDSTFDKKYDVVLPGRPSKVMFDFLKQYEKTHPGIEYIYRTDDKNAMTYASNKNGVIGEFESREDYVSLLRSGRISFYTTPGIDGGEKRTNGFNPVTPRFLELLAAGCMVMGRYPRNSDTEFYELDQLCHNIDSYTKFETVLDNLLQQKTYPKESYIKFLNKHYTSARANLLISILK